jgi:FkbM family methyltransferase
MPKLSTIHRKLLRPWTNEIQRVLAGKFHMPQTLTVGLLGEFQFRVENNVEISRTLDYGNEMVSLATLLFLLKPDDVVWDIGASVGLFTVHCASRCARVVAFEPDPATCSRLKENIALNNFCSHVQVKGLAVGNEKGTMELATDGLDGFAPVLAKGNLGRHGAVVQVPVETIDSLIKDGTPVPSVVKIDIEGAEVLALKGGQQLLSGETRPRLLFIEMHPQFLPNFGATADGTAQMVENFGYRLLSTQKRAEQYHLIALRSS